MTTFIAVLSAFVFQITSHMWAFFLVLGAAYVQHKTKQRMNSQLQDIMREGLSPKDAADYISYGLTNINIISSFVIYGFFIYAIYIFRQL